MMQVATLKIYNYIMQQSLVKGSNLSKLPIVAQVSYKKRFSENNAYVMQLRS
jgi:hypothetical protein